MEPVDLLASVARHVGQFVRRAPGTHVYLMVLLVTTATVRSLDPVLTDQLLRVLSTNLTQMGRSSGRVLILSAFLLDDDRWYGQVLVLLAVYIPLERWAGTWRWLGVIVVGHVGATLVTTFGIWADVRYNRNAAPLARAIDVGVSYGYFAAAALLTFALRGRWRWIYATGLTSYLCTFLVVRHTFTDAGHAAAALIGTVMYLLYRPGLTARSSLARPSGRPDMAPAR